MTRSTSITMLAAMLSMGAPLAVADTYDYTVDRFEADGNVHGPLDGTPDVVEEFDDGVMGPLDTLITTPKCDPRDGWLGRINLYRYLNHSDALPPACDPGSAQGLQRIDFRWTGTNVVKAKVRNASLPPVTGPIRVALYRGTGPVNDCDGYVGVANCIRVDTTKPKCSASY
jgi:hypothetical protein